MRLTRLPMTVLAAVASATALLAAPAAQAARPATPAEPAQLVVRHVAPARAFRRQVQQLKRFSPLPVLLPDRVAIDVPSRHGIEAKWAANRTSWSLSLGIGPRCGGANACFVGQFSAERGGRPSFRRTVGLRGGVTGYFKPTTCGASCSPPEIQWLRARVLYSVEFREAGPGSDRKKLVALADSALAAGPR